MTDISNLGRCDVCGEPIDMRDAEDELVIFESADDVEGFSVEDMSRAMEDALRRSGTPEDHAAADAFVENNGFVGHARCVEQTALTDMPMADEQRGPREAGQE